jgi:hypothetical protein
MIQMFRIIKIYIRYFSIIIRMELPKFLLGGLGKDVDKGKFLLGGLGKDVHKGKFNGNLNKQKKKKRGFYQKINNIIKFVQRVTTEDPPLHFSILKRFIWRVFQIIGNIIGFFLYMLFEAFVPLAVLAALIMPAAIFSIKVMKFIESVDPSAHIVVPCFFIFVCVAYGYFVLYPFMESITKEMDRIMNDPKNDPTNATLFGAITDIVIVFIDKIFKWIEKKAKEEELNNKEKDHSEFFKKGLLLTLLIGCYIFAQFTWIELIEARMWYECRDACFVLGCECKISCRCLFECTCKECFCMEECIQRCINIKKEEEIFYRVLALFPQPPRLADMPNDSYMLDDTYIPEEDVK